MTTTLPSPVSVPLGEASISSATESLPGAPAVFLVRLPSGAPYVARTADLRRRMARLLRPRQEASKALSLAGLAQSLEYWLTGSGLEASLLLYSLTRHHFPDDYSRRLKLRPAVFVKITLDNRFPRTMVTTRISGRPESLYGPFRNRATAEEFQAQALDLFQVRRCQEDLAPSPGHPGCIYGEMNACLRPCQMAVTEEEYRSETGRFIAFLESGGETLLASIAGMRDRFSEEMDFEEAARQHRRHRKVEEALKLRDGFAAPVARLGGVAVLPSAQAGAVKLWVWSEGAPRDLTEFSYAKGSAQPVSMDRQLRDLIGGMAAGPVRNRERQDAMAVLARWFYSSWRDGEWIGFPRADALPYRKLVRAISRVARSAPATRLETAASLQ